MTQMYKVKIGKQGRIVLPKEIREEYDVKAGDDAILIVKKDGITLRLHRSPVDPIEDLAELAQNTSIGLTPTELKQLADSERVKDLQAKRRTS